MRQSSNNENIWELFIIKIIRPLLFIQMKSPARADNPSARCAANCANTYLP